MGLSFRSKDDSPTPEYSGIDEKVDRAVGAESTEGALESAKRGSKAARTAESICALQNLPSIAFIFESGYNSPSSHLTVILHHEFQQFDEH